MTSIQHATIALVALIMEQLAVSVMKQTRTNAFHAEKANYAVSSEDKSAIQ